MKKVLTILCFASLFAVASCGQAEKKDVNTNDSTATELMDNMNNNPDQTGDAVNDVNDTVKIVADTVILAADSINTEVENTTDGE